MGNPVKARRQGPAPKRLATSHLRAAVFAAAKGRCQECDVALGLVDYWHIDHIVPIAEGGGRELTNLRALCVPCHLHKTTTENVRRERWRVALWNADNQQPE